MQKNSDNSSKRNANFTSEKKFSKEKKQFSASPKKKFSSEKPFKKFGDKKFGKQEKEFSPEHPFKKFGGKKFGKQEKEFSPEHPFKKFEKKKFEGNKDSVKKFFNQKFLNESMENKKVFSAEEKHDGDWRLNKFLAHAGVASRRTADELIKEGRVKVNGEIVVEMGFKVKPKDEVTFDGKLLSLEKKYYILLNKPKDFITTVSDERERRTVMELIRAAYPQMKSRTRPRLFPVGRLDRNTTGVLLITNDGELAQKLTHPSHQTKKVYHVVLNKKLTKEDFDKIAEGGVVLEDGIAEVDVIAYPNVKNHAEVGIEIHTGKNRFVRRIFEALDYEVEKLDRVYFAGLTKKDVPRGRWRFLTEVEVRNLKHFQK